MSSGPPAISRGTLGTLRIAGLRAGAFTSWRVVISPTTGMPTLFGEGTFARFFLGAQAARAELMPAPVPARIGRKKPPRPEPFVLIGRIVEFTPRSIVIAEGTIKTRA